MKKILILSFFLFALGGIASAQKKESKAKTEKQVQFLKKFIM